jgi:tetratricopeptide (TPR) repeat protein
VTPYFRGKYYYTRGNLTEAERSFLLVPDGTRYSLEGRYFLGVVHTARGDYARAMTVFREVLAMPAIDDDDAQVIDLANLAIGRLAHETQDAETAIDAYQRISTDSRYFDQALYEVGWVHIGRGDSTRARRALELLVIYDPNSRFAPEARILLGNILLREGRVVSSEECFLLNAERLIARDADLAFADGAVESPELPPLPAECLNRPSTASSDYAVEAFESVKRAYGSVYEGLAHAMSSREGLRAYFRDMIRSDVAAVTAPTMLPAEARTWFESDPGVSRVQAVLESLANVRRYVAEIERLVNQLETILSGRSMVGAYAELRGMRDRSVGLANRCARIRADLAADRDRLVAAPAGEAAQVRQERRALEEQIRLLPVDSEGLSGVYEAQRTGIDTLSQQLTEVAHLIELVYSVANSLDQYLVLPENWGELSEAEVGAIRAEVQLVRGAVAHYRGQADELRRQVETVRARVQVGEVSTEAARDLRDRHRALVEREGALLGAGAAAPVAAALAALGAVEADLAAVDRVLEGQAGDRSRTLLARVREERGRLDGYRSRLSGIETAAEQVVGEYAFHNFETIAARFAELMLRSDVGVADAAYSLVEEHRQRQRQMEDHLRRSQEAIRMEYDDLPPSN